MPNNLPRTAVVLTRDEERCIERCLQSLTPEYVDEILVVDTGSVDSTVQKAREHRANKVHVVTHAWTNDFAAARNRALDVVNNGWTLFVDADEHFEPGQAVKLRSMLGELAHDPHAQNIVISPIIVDSGGFECAGVGRFLLADGNVRYFGAVHEEPRLRIGATGDVRSILSDIRLRHDGYDPAVVRLKNKAGRNADLLQLCREREPDNPRWLYEEFRARLWAESRDHATRYCSDLADMRTIPDSQGSRSPAAEMYYGLALRDLARRACAEGDMAWLEEVCHHLEYTAPDSPDTLYFKHLAAIYPHAAHPSDSLLASPATTARLRVQLDELITVRQSVSDFQPQGLHPSHANLDALICTYLDTLGMTSQAEKYRQTIDGSWNESPFIHNRFEGAR